VCVIGKIGVESELAVIAERLILFVRIIRRSAVAIALGRKIQEPRVLLRLLLKRRLGLQLSARIVIKL
jgi:hypothetical protein